MKTYAFIFARGGSKGLPGKNIKNLNGKPLLAYSIEMAKSVEAIEEVFVSSDDDDIKAVALKYKAKVISRPKNLATDNSPEIDSWRHAIKFLKQSGNSFDRFISLPTTAPLRSKIDIENALQAFTDSSDVVVTITESARNPFFNLMRYNEEGYLETFAGKNSIQRRQDAPECFDLTTVAYVSSPDYILHTSNLLDGKVSAVNIPFERAIDIDNETDFFIAEALLRRQINDEK